MTVKIDNALIFTWKSVKNIISHFKVYFLSRKHFLQPGKGWGSFFNYTGKSFWRSMLVLRYEKLKSCNVVTFGDLKLLDEFQAQIPLNLNMDITVN
jgi:hypothetical protein